MDKIDIVADVYENKVELIFPCGKIVIDKNVDELRTFFEDSNRKFDFNEIYHFLIGDY